MSYSVLHKRGKSQGQKKTEFTSDSEDHYSLIVSNFPAVHSYLELTIFGYLRVKRANDHDPYLYHLGRKCARLDRLKVPFDFCPGNTWLNVCTCHLK